MRLIIIPIASIVVVFDQISKFIVRGTLPLYDSVNIIPGFLNFTHIRNSGSAFGILSAADFPLKPAIMIAAAVMALIAIIIYTIKTESSNLIAHIGLAFIIGGAIGNLIDRLLAGYVIDFVDVFWNNYHFWVFNVADSAITVGASLLIIDSITLRRNVSKTI